MMAVDGFGPSSQQHAGDAETHQPVVPTSGAAPRNKHGRNTSSCCPCIWRLQERWPSRGKRRKSAADRKTEDGGSGLGATTTADAGPLPGDRRDAPGSRGSGRAAPPAAPTQELGSATDTAASLSVILSSAADDHADHVPNKRGDSNTGPGVAIALDMKNIDGASPADARITPHDHATPPGVNTSEGPDARSPPTIIPHLGVFCSEGEPHHDTAPPGFPLATEGIEKNTQGRNYNNAAEPRTKYEAPTRTSDGAAVSESMSKASKPKVSATSDEVNKSKTVETQQLHGQLVSLKFEPASSSSSSSSEGPQKTASQGPRRVDESSSKTSTNQSRTPSDACTPVPASGTSHGSRSRSRTQDRFGGGGGTSRDANTKSDFQLHAQPGQQSQRIVHGSKTGAASSSSSVLQPQGAQRGFRLQDGVRGGTVVSSSEGSAGHRGGRPTGAAGPHHLQPGGATSLLAAPREQTQSRSLSRHRVRGQLLETAVPEHCELQDSDDANDKEVNLLVPGVSAARQRAYSLEGHQPSSSAGAGVLGMGGGGGGTAAGTSFVQLQDKRKDTSSPVLQSENVENLLANYGAYVAGTGVPQVQHQGPRAAHLLLQQGGNIYNDEQTSTYLHPGLYSSYNAPQHYLPPLFAPGHQQYPGAGGPPHLEHNPYFAAQPSHQHAMFAGHQLQQQPATRPLATAGSANSGGKLQQSQSRSLKARIIDDHQNGVGGSSSQQQHTFQPRINANSAKLAAKHHERRLIETAAAEMRKVSKGVALAATSGNPAPPPAQVQDAEVSPTTGAPAPFGALQQPHQHQHQQPLLLHQPPPMKARSADNLEGLGLAGTSTSQQQQQTQLEVLAPGAGGPKHHSDPTSFPGDPKTAPDVILGPGSTGLRASGGELWNFHSDNRAPPQAGTQFDRGAAGVNFPPSSGAFLMKMASPTSDGGGIENQNAVAADDGDLHHHQHGGYQYFSHPEMMQQHLHAPALTSMTLTADATGHPQHQLQHDHLLSGITPQPRYWRRPGQYAENFLEAHPPPARALDQESLFSGTDGARCALTYKTSSSEVSNSVVTKKSSEDQKSLTSSSSAGATFGAGNSCVGKVSSDGSNGGAAPGGTGIINMASNISSRNSLVVEKKSSGGPQQLEPVQEVAVEVASGSGSMPHYEVLAAAAAQPQRQQFGFGVYPPPQAFQQNNMSDEYLSLHLGRNYYEKDRTECLSSGSSPPLLVVPPTVVPPLHSSVSSPPEAAGGSSGGAMMKSPGGRISGTSAGIKTNMNNSSGQPKRRGSGRSSSGDEQASGLGGGPVGLSGIGAVSDPQVLFKQFTGLNLPMPLSVKSAPGGGSAGMSMLGGGAGAEEVLGTKGMVGARRLSGSDADDSAANSSAASDVYRTVAEQMAHAVLRDHGFVGAGGHPNDQRTNRTGQNTATQQRVNFQEGGLQGNINNSAREQNNRAHDLDQHGAAPVTRRTGSAERQRLNSSGAEHSKDDNFVLFQGERQRQQLVKELLAHPASSSVLQSIKQRAYGTTTHWKPKHQNKPKRRPAPPTIQQRLQKWQPTSPRSLSYRDEYDVLTLGENYHSLASMRRLKNMVDVLHDGPGSAVKKRAATVEGGGTGAGGRGGPEQDHGRSELSGFGRVAHGLVVRGEDHDLRRTSAGMKSVARARPLARSNVNGAHSAGSMGSQATQPGGGVRRKRRQQQDLQRLQREAAADEGGAAAIPGAPGGSEADTSRSGSGPRHQAGGRINPGGRGRHQPRAPRKGSDECSSSAAELHNTSDARLYLSGLLLDENRPYGYGNTAREGAPPGPDGGGGAEEEKAGETLLNRRGRSESSADDNTRRTDRPPTGAPAAAASLLPLPAAATPTGNSRYLLSQLRNKTIVIGPDPSPSPRDHVSPSPKTILRPNYKPATFPNNSAAMRTPPAKARPAGTSGLEDDRDREQAEQDVDLAMISPCVEDFSEDSSMLRVLSQHLADELVDYQAVLPRTGGDHGAAAQNEASAQRAGDDENFLPAGAQLRTIMGKTQNSQQRPELAQPAVTELATKAECEFSDGGLSQFRRHFGLHADDDRQFSSTDEDETPAAAPGRRPAPAPSLLQRTRAAAAMIAGKNTNNGAHSRRSTSSPHKRVNTSSPDESNNQDHDLLRPFGHNDPFTRHAVKLGPKSATETGTRKGKSASNPGSRVGSRTGSKHRSTYDGAVLGLGLDLSDNFVNDLIKSKKLELLNPTVDRWDAEIVKAQRRRSASLSSSAGGGHNYNSSQEPPKRRNSVEERGRVDDGGNRSRRNSSAEGRAEDGTNFETGARGAPARREQQGDVDEFGFPHLNSIRAGSGTGIPSQTQTMYPGNSSASASAASSPGDGGFHPVLPGGGRGAMQLPWSTSAPAAVAAALRENLNQGEEQPARSRTSRRNFFPGMTNLMRRAVGGGGAQEGKQRSAESRSHNSSLKRSAIKSSKEIIDTYHAYRDVRGGQ